MFHHETDRNTTTFTDDYIHIVTHYPSLSVAPAPQRPGLEGAKQSQITRYYGASIGDCKSFLSKINKTFKFSQKFF
jgi:hypothetical protein